MKKRRITKIRSSPYVQCERCGSRMTLFLSLAAGRGFYEFCYQCSLYEWL